MRCLSVLDLEPVFIHIVSQCRSLLEIVFCRTVFVCLGFGHFILFVYFFPPRSSKGPRMGRQFFKNVDFSVTYPLKGV